MSDNKSSNNPDAAELGRRGGLKGGKARAASMTQEELREAAQKAAAGRWAPKATHMGVIKIGEKGVACANLENGVRVLSQREFYVVIGGTKQTSVSRSDQDRAGDVPAFLSAKNLQPFISKELRATVSAPIKYRFEHIGEDGKKSLHQAHGIDAVLIPEICDVFLKARDDDALHHTQFAIAKAAEILMRALARAGIIALVDEATGYQAERDRDELARLVDAYVKEEWKKTWNRRFSHEFFKQLHRIQGWAYTEKQTTHPQYVGKLINEYIYGRMPLGVLERLRQVNPTIDGRRKRKHTQHLTDDTGIPHLDKQIDAVTTLLAVSDDKAMFEELLQRRFPKPGDQTNMFTRKPTTDKEEK